MGLQIETTEKGTMPAAGFVPAWRGNRESVEPFSVDVSPMTAGELAKAKAHDFRRIQGDGAVGAARAHRNAVISARVSAVYGVEGSKGEPVENGKQLVAMIQRSTDASMDEILDEIYEAITDASKLAEGRRPNS
jgi:hypothetical protein